MGMLLWYKRKKKVNLFFLFELSYDLNTNKKDGFEIQSINHIKMEERFFYFIIRT